VGGLGEGGGNEREPKALSLPPTPPPSAQLRYHFFLFFKAIVVFVEFLTIYFVLSPSSFRETEIIQNQDIN